MVIGILIGLGVCIGFTAWACCAAAGEYDEWEEEQIRKSKEQTVEKP